MTRRERYLGWSLIVLTLAWALAYSLVEARRLMLRGEIYDEGCGYGTRFIGLPFPHFRRHLNLLKRDHDGRWVLLWHSVSSRLDNSFSWQDKIVFGAVTSMEETEDRRIRILVYQRSNGSIVDITQPLMRFAGTPGKKGLTWMTVVREGEMVHWKYTIEKTHRVTTTLNQLCDFAREVRHHGRRRVFDEFGVWEERE